MKDRVQKQKALRYSISMGWLPQLEVDVYSHTSVGSALAVMTDLDLLALIPDELVGFRRVVFDCKTRGKESPINRALWLRGVLDRFKAAQGFCILKKNVIEADHRLLGIKLGVVLIEENEFDLYAKATSNCYGSELGNAADIDIWDKLFQLGGKYPGLKHALLFSQSSFWMIEDAAEACRKCIATLQEANSELDPNKPDHMAVALDYACIFSYSVAIISSYIFKTYLHPKQQVDLEEAIKMLLYGGRESYEHRNQLFKLLKERKGAKADNADLSLPQWAQFLKLIRQILDGPSAAARTPLILRELAFSHLAEPPNYDFTKKLCQLYPQAGRFAVLCASYLFTAAKLPSEFVANAENTLIPLLNRQQ